MIMTCLVLLSDASKAFPTNTSSHFMVRLSEPLQLEEERIWQVGLLSLSMPAARLQLDELTATETGHLVCVSYLADNTVRKDARFTANDLSQTLSITDGVGLMKSSVGLLEWMQTGSNHYRRDEH